MAEKADDPIKELLIELKRGKSSKKVDSKKVDAALNYHNKVLAGVATQNEKKEDEHPSTKKLLDKCQQENMVLKRELIETRNKLNAISRQSQNDQNEGTKNPKFDLNDPFRASILAEQFRSIYEGEWKNAFDALIKHKKAEAEVITILVHTVKGADQLCTSAMTQHLGRIEQVALEDLKLVKVQLPGNKEGVLMPDSATIATKEETERSKRLIREYIKSLGHLSIPGLVQLFNSNYLQPILTEHDIPATDEKLIIFINKVINILWKTKMADRPLAFVWQECGEPFSKNLSTPYKQHGNQVLYPVWPAILSHQGGPILYKGIVMTES